MVQKKFDAADYEIKEGMDEAEIVALLPKIHKLIYEVLDTYMDLNPEVKEIVAAWVLSAPYYQIFEAFPYLFINASKNSGKSRLLRLLSELIPDSLMVVSLSQSALFRVRSSKTALMLDEAERLHGKEKENLLDLLNSGYKRGSKVIRAGKGPKGEIRIEEFPVYGPIAMANIWGLDSVLGSRCLTVVLQKSSNSKIIRTPEMYDWDPRIKAVREYLCRSVVYVGRVGETSLLGGVRDVFLYNNNIILPTLLTSTTTNIDVPNFLELVKVVQVEARDFELWLPLITITYIADPLLAQHIVEVAKTQAEERKEDEAEEDRDGYYAIQLYDYMNGLQPHSPLIFKEFLQTIPDAPEWLRAEWLARFIKRIGIRQSQKRTKTGNEYQIRMSALKNYLQVRGLLIDAVQAPGTQPAPGASSNIQEPQTLLKTQMQAKDEQMPQNTLKIEKKDERRLPLVCQQCTSEAQELFEWGSLRVCKDCLEEIKNPPDRTEEEE